MAKARLLPGWLPASLLFLGRVLLRTLVFTTEFILGLLIFVVLVVFFVLSSQWGRETILNEGLTLAIDMTPFTADISGVQSATSDSWQIRQFTLYYEEERLLELRHFQLRLPWKTLFEQKIRLDEISLGEVWLQADPSRWPQGSPDDAGDEPPGVSLPQWLNDWQAELGTLSVGHFSTQHPLMPRPLTASLTAEGFRLAEIASVTPLITLDNFNLQIDEGAQWVRGSLQNASPDAKPDAKISATVRLDHFPLDVLSLVMDDFNTGWLSAELTVAGPLLNPQVAGSVETSTQLLQMPLVASTRISYEALGIRFSQLEGSWDSLRVKAGGSVDLTDNSLDIVVAQATMPLGFVSNFGAELPAELQLDASARDVRVVGTFDGIRYRGIINGKGRYAALPLNLQANVAGGLEQLQLHQVSLQADTLQVEASGNLDFKGPVHAAASFKGLTRQILSQAGIELPPEIAAQLAFDAAGRLEISKSLSAPRFSADLTMDGAYGQEPVQLQTRLSGSLQRLNIEEFTLHLQPEPQSATQSPGLVASGDIDLQKARLDLTLQARTLPLRLVSLGGASLPPDLDGNLSLLAAVKGPWTLPDVKARALLEGHLKSESLRLSLDGNFSQGALHIRESSLQLNNDKLVSVAGRVSATEHTLGINVAEFNLQRLQPLGLKGVEGIVSADIRYLGDAENFGLAGRVSYRTDLQLLDVGGQAEPSTLQVEAQIATTEKVTGVTTQMTINGQQAGDLKVRIPVTLYRQWTLAKMNETPEESQSGEAAQDSLPANFSLVGNADLRAFQVLLQNELQSFGGMARLDLKADGTVDALQLDGEVALDKGYYVNELTGTDLREIDFLAVFHEQTVEIRQGSARTPEGGTLTLSGNAGWTEDLPVNIKLLADKAALLERPDIEAALSGEIGLHGTREGYVLGGRLQLQPLTLSISSSFSGVPEIDVHVIEKTEEQVSLTKRKPQEATPIPLDLDLTIIADQQAYLRGRGLVTELKGEVRVVGPASNPRFTGQFQTIRGHVELFGKRFQIVEGAAEFDGSNVLLNLQAEYVGPDETFKIGVSGTLDEFKLELTSDPVLPQDEILAKLLFGKSIKNITPIQAVRLVQAIQTLQGGNSLLPDPIAFARDLVGVDELNVESTETDEGQGVTVGVGKYLSEGVYLELKRTPDPNQPWQGKLDIELTPRLHLETTTSGSAGDEGVELIWKKDY